MNLANNVFVRAARQGGVLCLVTVWALFGFPEGPPAATASAAGTALTVSQDLPPGAIVVLGDSLSAGYRLPAEEAWPKLLGDRLGQEGCRYTVINAGISGDTTAGGLARVGALLDRLKPVLLVIGLGANDGLRGLPLEQMRRNLDRIVHSARSQNVAVLLVGMQIPPNYGPAYADAFYATFQEVAAEHRVALLPFLLEPIASELDFFLEDGLHPNVEGQRRVMDHVLAGLREQFKLSCQTTGE